MKSSPQLQLFPAHLVAWETLPPDCQQSIQELLSLLLEQSLSRPQHESETKQLEEEKHV